MVTGATGYVAGWLVKKLLDEGFTVHAPIRNPGNKDKTKYLDALAKNSGGKIVYFKADLLEKGSYDEAVRDCELVFHTASPFSVNVKDTKKQLLDPALEGTRNVLNSASKSESVKRVVLTSSCAAIYGDNIDLQEIPNKTLTEENWNTTSSLDHQAYSYSKVMAEKEAWKIAEKQQQWDLVVINPSFVIGPGINPQGTSESFNYIKQLGDGTMKMGAPEIYLGCVDVRDLADAHYKAGFTPDAKGRHIISNTTESFLSLADYLREEFGDAYPFPKSYLPKWLVWILGPFSGLSRKMVRRNVGYAWAADNSKSKEELGVRYRPMKASITDFFKQMIEEGLVDKRG